MKKFIEAFREQKLYKKHFLLNKTKANIRIAYYYRIIGGEEKANYIVFLNYSDSHLINKMKLEIIL